MSRFTSYTEYLIDRRFNSNRFLFTFTPVACSIFNFNEKAIRRQVLIRFVDRSVYRGLLFGPPRMLPHWWCCAWSRRWRHVIRVELTTPATQCRVAITSCRLSSRESTEHNNSRTTQAILTHASLQIVHFPHSTI